MKKKSTLNAVFVYRFMENIIIKDMKMKKIKIK